MSDLELDPAVGRLVSEWLDKHDPVSEEEQVPMEELDFSPRPARPSMSDADRRLAGALRKQQAEAQREHTEVPVNTDEVESRAQVVVPKKRGRGRPRKYPLPTTPHPMVSRPNDVATLSSAAKDDGDFGRPEHNAGVANGMSGNGQAHAAPSVGFVKRKKIRSRQKNLRRDNRPKDALPPHLTEETLRAGRVYKQDVPNGSESVNASDNAPGIAPGNASGNGPDIGS